MLVSVALADCAERRHEDARAGARRSHVPANVELVTVSSPSVWNMPPPCHAVDVLPLNVLLTIVALPSDRRPPATSTDRLPLTVLRVMLIVALKNP